MRGYYMILKNAILHDYSKNNASRVLRVSCNNRTLLKGGRNNNKVIHTIIVWSLRNISTRVAGSRATIGTSRRRLNLGRKRRMQASIAEF